MLGNWKINVNTSGMPQKVATAFANLNTELIGSEYEFIAYLGSQEVNGTNHAVLATQVITTGRDTKNIVVLIFNEKPNENVATLVSIDRVVESGEQLGGTKIDVNLAADIPDDVMDVWNEAFMGYVGSNPEPVALLGTKMTNGTNLIFVAQLLPIFKEQEQENEVVLVIINDKEKRVKFTGLLEDRVDNALGYAFSW